MTLLTCFIFFLSGASALIFESLWFQLAGLLLGNSVWAAALVLAGFMGGLAVGNALAASRGQQVRSPLRLYVVLQIIIALSGFSLVLVFPHLTALLLPVFRAVGSNMLVLNSLRMLLAFLLLLLPTSAMGATLPFLVKALSRQNTQFGSVLGVLYGCNTLGAVFGVMASELLLVRWFGLAATGAVAALLNIISALGAVLVLRAIRRPVDEPVVAVQQQEMPVFTPRARRMLAASFIAGLNFLALEVVWFRFMSQFFNAFSWFFAVMLAVVLAGISCGGFAAASWLRRQVKVVAVLPALFFLTGVLLVAGYSSFGVVLKVVFSNFHEYRSALLAAVALMFPVSVLSGVLFTALGKVLQSELNAAVRSTGLLTLANTTGGMCGSLIGGMVLIPWLGVEGAFFFLALSYGLAALLVAERLPEPAQMWPRLISRVVMVALIICLLLFPHGMMQREYLLFPIQELLDAGAQRVAVREGRSETVQYLQYELLDEPYYHRLVTNNYTMADTGVVSRRYMKFFAYLPLAINPLIKDALLICYGCGSTAKALTETDSLRSLDIVDISQDVIDLSSTVFPDRQDNPIHDPRTTVHIEDGRFFLQTTQRMFDLITGEPPPPKSSGVVNLYTQEYFQLLYDRLADGGLVTYWLPVGKIEVEETKAILKAFSNVFEHCSLWSGSGFHWMMAGSKQPRSLASEESFRGLWSDPLAGPELRNLGFASAEQFGSWFIADGRRLRQWVGDVLPLVDNFPGRLSYQLPQGHQASNAYWRFMRPEAARENFMQSSLITTLWPRTLRRQAADFFPASSQVNELLIKGTPLVKYLHQFLADPRLNHYLVWSLFSDHDAQRLSNTFLRDKSLDARTALRSCMSAASQALEDRDVQQARQLIRASQHFAAAVVEEGDYVLAEQYYRLAEMMAAYGKRFELVYLRMYLLFRADKQQQARMVADAFITMHQQGEAERRIEVEKCWQWLEETFAPNVAENPV